MGLSEFCTFPSYSLNIPAPAPALALAPAHAATRCSELCSRLKLGSVWRWISYYYLSSLRMSVHGCQFAGWMLFCDVQSTCSELWHTTAVPDAGYTGQIALYSHQSKIVSIRYLYTLTNHKSCLSDIFIHWPITNLLRYLYTLVNHKSCLSDIFIHWPITNLLGYLYTLVNHKCCLSDSYTHWQITKVVRYLYTLSNHKFCQSDIFTHCPITNLWKYLYTDRSQSISVRYLY